MRRKLKNYISEYDKKFYNSDKSTFYASDINELIEMSEDEGQVALCDVIINSLKSGFMIGYKRALQDVKKNAEKK